MEIQMDVAPSRVTSFLNLPLELRQRVYLLYFQPGRVIDTRFLETWLDHENLGLMFSHLKALLRIDVLRVEAMQPFLRSSIFDITRLGYEEIAWFQQLIDNKCLDFSLLSCICHATIVLKEATLESSIPDACAALVRFSRIQTLIIDAKDLVVGRDDWCSPDSPLFRQIATLPSLRSVKLVWEVPSHFWEDTVQHLKKYALRNICVALVQAGKVDVDVEQQCTWLRRREAEHSERLEISRRRPQQHLEQIETLP